MAQVKERAAARKIYDAAKKQGKTAGLVATKSVPGKICYFFFNFHEIRNLNVIFKKNLFYFQWHAVCFPSHKHFEE